MVRWAARTFCYKRSEIGKSDKMGNFVTAFTKLVVLNLFVNAVLMPVALQSIIIHNVAGDLCWPILFSLIQSVVVGSLIGW